ncbi:hypothetical protein BC936DRAFT_146847 [Jimgerdemannia flammicorona]|uniref:Uncharacterized protein n=1 Tax=Jimgerdemannia flammicorona TaxID=994334 RepID=A0A433DL79_9FUNG|nr:hypothetical protein BC936DRAFT_146847 [Jimgerdemannia flammicorona]
MAKQKTITQPPDVRQQPPAILPPWKRSCRRIFVNSFTTTKREKKLAIGNYSVNSIKYCAGFAGTDMRPHLPKQWIPQPHATRAQIAIYKCFTLHIVISGLTFSLRLPKMQYCKNKQDANPSGRIELHGTSVAPVFFSFHTVLVRRAVRRLLRLDNRRRRAVERQLACSRTKSRGRKGMISGSRSVPKGRCCHGFTAPTEYRIDFSSVQSPLKATFSESVEAGHSLHDDAARVAALRMGSQIKFAQFSGDTYLRLSDFDGAWVGGACPGFSFNQPPITGPHLRVTGQAKDNVLRSKMPNRQS